MVQILKVSKRKNIDFKTNFKIFGRLFSNFSNVFSIIEIFYSIQVGSMAFLERIFHFSCFYYNGSYFSLLQIFSRIKMQNGCQCLYINFCMDRSVYFGENWAVSDEFLLLKALHLSWYRPQLLRFTLKIFKNLRKPWSTGFDEFNFE